ncbi:MAG: hypothetical protein FJX32_14385 [Alphaproteobacteria bacterium]|nr:hypothetical protein [Alphaproteobacteria bacterium]
MRLLSLPLSMLLLLLTLGGCLASGGHYSQSQGYGYGSYGHAPYGGHGYRPYHHHHRAWEPPRHYRHQQHTRPIFPHRPIWKKW